jgi:hypothetical protein
VRAQVWLTCARACRQSDRLWLQPLRTPTCSFTKPRGAFDSQEAYDSYLETVEDIGEAAVLMGWRWGLRVCACVRARPCPRAARCPPRACCLGAVYKLSNNIDVAEVEQQIQDYIRQEVSGTGDRRWRCCACAARRGADCVRSRGRCQRASLSPPARALRAGCTALCARRPPQLCPLQQMPGPTCELRWGVAWLLGRARRPAQQHGWRSPPQACGQVHSCRRDVCALLLPLRCAAGLPLSGLCCSPCRWCPCCRTPRGV